MLEREWKRNMQLNQKENHDNTKQLREFELGNEVFVKNFRPGPTGIIIKRTGPLSYHVRLLKEGKNNIVRQHVDHAD